MRGLLISKRRPAAGFSLVGILLVVVIIFVLVGYYFGKSPIDLDKTQQDVNLYQTSMDKTTHVVQGENLRVFQQQVEMWAVSHPGEPCTLEKLQAAGISIPAPPAGQKWEIDADNKVRLAPVEESHPMSVRGVPTSPNGP